MSQSHTYQLNFFNRMGRAEVARMCFVVAEVEYEDRRIDFKDWPEEKKNAPQGTLPYLKIDGEIIVSQSAAIFRYLAREFCLYGTSNMEALFIDEIVETAGELCIKGVDVKHESDETKKEEMSTKLYGETAPKCFGILEKLVAERGKNGFAVGSKLSLADLQLHLMVDFLGIKNELLAKYPKLKANRISTSANTKIAAWLKIRPVTPF